MFGGLDLSLAVAAGLIRIRGDRGRRALFAGANLAGPGRVIRLRGGHAWRTQASAPRHSGLTICCASGISVEPRRLSRESRRKGELMIRTTAPIAGAALATRLVGRRRCMHSRRGRLRSWPSRRRRRPSWSPDQPQWRTEQARATQIAIALSRGPARVPSERPIWNTRWPNPPRPHGPRWPTARRRVGSISRSLSRSCSG